MLFLFLFFFLIVLRPPRSTRPVTLFPHTSLFRSVQPRDDPRRKVAATADEDQYVARRDAPPVLAMFDPVLNLVGDRARQEQAGGVARRHRGIVRPRFAFAFVALVVGGGIDRLEIGRAPV